MLPATGYSSHPMGQMRTNLQVRVYISPFYVAICAVVCREVMEFKLKCMYIASQSFVG